MKGKNILLAAIYSQYAGKGAGYGLDCSFPIHYDTFSNECGDLGDRRDAYQTYMNGCKAHYSPEDCEREEGKRLAMSRRQPQSMVNYTSGGFRKVSAPPSLKKILSEFWENNKDKAEDEQWDEGNIYTNHWEVPTKLIAVENEDYVGGGPDIVDAIWEVTKKEVENWAGIKMRPSSVYGIRVYMEGAVLNPHVDRLPLVSSCIVNVAQDVDEDWPLEVYDRFGEAVNITMQPFDMVFYESHSLIHGRPFPLKGRYFANIFIHFESIGECLHGGCQEPKDKNGILPPYILPTSPEAELWLSDHPSGWSKAMDEDDLYRINILAETGGTEELKEYLDLEPHLVNYQDEEGWRPIHEAIGGGHTETVQFLIERGADFNARPKNGRGASPLNLAKKILGVDHPITVMLQRIGAQDIESEVGSDEDDADDDEYAGDDDDERDED